MTLDTDPPPNKNAGDAPREWTPVPLATDHVTLRPVVSEDYSHLYLAEIMWLGPRWRHRGFTEAPEDFVRRLWAGVAAQFLVVRNRDHEKLGLVSVTNLDMQSGHAELVVGRFSPTLSRDFLDGVRLFISHVFDVWPLHKLYLHVAEYNLSQLSSTIGSLFQIEGRLLDYLRTGTGPFDLLILSASKAAWLTRYPNPNGRTPRPDPED